MFGTSDKTVESIRGRLGQDVVLLPIPDGRKAPAMKAWSSLTIAAMSDPAHLAQLRLGNIGVLLGGPSNGLCTVDIDDDGQVAPFLERNPRLAATLRTRRARGCNFWIRVRGAHPPLTKLATGEGKAWGEWRADGGQTLIYGQVDGIPYGIVVDATPVEMAFEEIEWPPELGNPFATPDCEEPDDFASNPSAELERNYGRPVYRNTKGNVSALNERYFAGLYAMENCILHEPAEQTFYRYEPPIGLWRPLTPEAIKDDLASRLLRYNQEADLGPAFEKLINQKNLNAIANALKGVVERVGVFADKQPVIHVGNGMIRFRDDGGVDFGGFGPEFYSRNRSPIRFDGDAECPRFLNELVYPAMTAEDADLLQRFMGLALYGYNLPQRFLILDGTAGGGKGTVVNILCALVGTENYYQLRTSLLHERFETYRYRGKTLLYGPDVAGDFLMERPASMLKSLVGGDPLSAEGKGSNENFPMRGTFVVLITCNSRLRIRLEGDVGAWRRRMLIIRYERPPPKKRILDFDKILIREEGAGILRWALAGFVKLMGEFKESGDFMLSDAQRTRVDALLDESDSLRRFVESEVVREEGASVTVTEAIHAYAEFCATKGWNPLPITVIERQLPDLMLGIHQATKSQSIPREGRSQRGFRRVRLKNEAIPEGERAEEAMAS